VQHAWPAGGEEENPRPPGDGEAPGARRVRTGETFRVRRAAGATSLHPPARLVMRVHTHFTIIAKAAGGPHPHPHPLPLSLSQDWERERGHTDEVRVRARRQQ